MDLPDVGSSTLNFDLFSKPTCSRESSLHIPQKTTWGPSISPPSNRNISVQITQGNFFEDVDLHRKSLDSASSQDQHLWDSLENIAALGLSFNAESTELNQSSGMERFSIEDAEGLENQSLKPNRPFKKWARSFEHRGLRRRKTVSCDTSTPSVNRDLFESPGTQRRSNHKKSTSSSSFGLVTAVKSASISLASFSIAKKTNVSSSQQRTDRSSKTSHIGRTSEDSTYKAKGIIVDQAVINRLLQRRRVLEEIINTEEGYVADVKFLMNVYVTLLASIPSLSLNLRASINRNLNEILELHEELLGELHQAVPHSEYTQINCIVPSFRTSSGGHQRWHSLDAVPENTSGSSWLQKIPGMTAEPKIAAEVARVFGKKINRLFIYEEYGAKYEMMIKDISSTYRTIPQWQVFQKGLEALASSLSSINNQQDGRKKAMTIGDLLVKPIQRVCKYQLLFAELLKQTPVCDCPDSHMEIETVLMRLREATTEINRAADDPRMKSLMEKSWRLQDRVLFPDMPDARSKNIIRSLGHIVLCGVLHVSWQTQNAVDASSPKLDQTYNVQACIGLSEIGIEEVDNGKGLQCHTVRFSWKLVFECDHQLYELTMSACSPKEELEWRNRIMARSRKGRSHTEEWNLYSFISLPAKPLGTVFGKPGSIARRISVHRATTVGPISGLCQVIIKNTNAFNGAPCSATINRSQSLLTTNRTPVLAPSILERTRLETLLVDVWTREILPYPGMAHRARSEHIARVSASSMMRKLSVASIASNFTKRSGSMASMPKTAEDEDSPRSDKPKSASSITKTEIKSPDSCDKLWSQYPIIQDEKENLSHKESFENLRAMIFGINSSFISSTRDKSLKFKKSWALDCHRIITPSSHTSSTGSINHHKLVTLPAPVPIQATNDAIEKNKHNIIHWGMVGTLQKDCKKVKVSGKGRSGVSGSIRSFFR
ncbi:hypothetical protein K3495_g425 [Podosphaera aphanis]|nr:hypothetical protein K3495_g425 [Podosphaera aphanis]